MTKPLMRPDERDLDEEIRGHLAISVKERMERGEDPEAARLAALREFGYVPAIHDSMRRVWYSRWFDAAEALARDIRLQPVFFMAAIHWFCDNRAGMLLLPPN
jgi:hypothetical protein